MLIMKSMHLITMHFWKSLCNVHTTQEKYENGALRFGLPSSLIRRENGALFLRFGLPSTLIIYS